ncbi:MAG TPA: thioredoxin domain-containing protein [Bacteroidota bacterium]|nr:thioredoxin domain-containing protein [Bacteroidota bacterium]
MNKLFFETSPYLKQHANNPINWYPWSDEAFNIAIKENKLIFLSIGYFSCHWCHVMEKECFEDFEIANLLNKYFVSIKVDREERPDIDSIYMKFCIEMTGSGGWPLTIVMTNDKKPFFAGTYLPKYDKYNNIGLLNLLNKVIEIKNTNEKLLYEYSHKITEEIKNNNNLDSDNYHTLDEIAKNNFKLLESNYDIEYGGFGNSMKFPQVNHLLFLYSYSIENNSTESFLMVKNTIERIFKGGIYDHIEFGIHRYSVDRYWRIPHFEKMLYDQAMMLLLLQNIYDKTKDIFYKNKIEEIIKYITEHLKSNQNVFYSAEDADSEGEEGLYYIWNTNELKNLLSDDFKIFNDIFLISESGNFINGFNVLFFKDKIQQNHLSFFESKLRDKLKEYRQKRVPPGKDTKILTDWNCLTISAITKAAHILNNSKYKDIATLSLDWILENLTKDAEVYHCIQKGNNYIDGFLSDYAYLIFALLNHYVTTTKKKYLEKAIKLNKKLFERFYDNKKLFLTSNSSDSLILKVEDKYDNVIPSGLSVTYENLLLLYNITGETKYIKLREELFNNYKSEISLKPHMFSFFLYSYLNSKNKFIVITVTDDTNNLKDEFIKEKIPIANIIFLNNDNKKSKIEYQICINNQCMIFKEKKDIISFIKNELII